MQVDVFNIEGNVVKQIDLPDTVYGVKVSDAVLHSVVKAYLANKRQGTHATKTRSLVSGGGKKPFKQKGTGRARQGSSRVPVYPGGATSHGPQPRDYTQKLNQKVKSLALKMALSDRMQSKKLVVFDDFGVSSYSTKNVLKIMKTFNATKVLFTDERKDDYLLKSSANIYGTSCIGASELNAYNVLSHDVVFICEKALTTIQQRLEDK